MTTCIFLFDGFSDWEIAYLTPEIAQQKNSVLITFSLEGTPVRSVGGLKITPDRSLEQIHAHEVSAIVLPGGTMWEQGKITGLDPLVKTLHDRNKIIAAICGATIFLAEKGYLDSISHTSNGLAYLKKFAPHYQGEKYYTPVPAVTGRNIITANGTAPVEFAREIFMKIKLFNQEDIEKWYQLFKHGIWSE
jgi:putative intracellular protease/amidase